MTHVRNDEGRQNRKTTITQEEFKQILECAGHIEDPFLRLRSAALQSVLRLTGKRRGEVAGLSLDSVKVEHGFLWLTFALEKKKKHFKQCQNCESKNRVKAVYCSNCGLSLSESPVKSSSKPDSSFKKIELKPKDPVTNAVLEYLELLNGMKAKPKYLFPRTHQLWGTGYTVDLNEHIRGRQVFNLTRQLSEDVWPHLYRESAAADIVRADPSIISAFKVQQRLDLESYTTGFNYLKRFAADIIERSE